MKKKKILLFLLIIFGGFVCIRSISFAKYASNSVWNYYLKSQGFYFESDDLSEDNKNNVNTLWDGSDIAFNVRNNLNQSLITDFDIEYEVSCEVVGNDYLTCLVNDKHKYTGILSSFQVCTNNESIDTSSLTKTECELKGYTWTHQVATNNLSFKIVKNNEDYTMNDVTVNVYAKSISPYKKTLQGTYKLHYTDTVVGEIKKSYEKYENYNRLTITNTYDTDKCISVSFDGKTKVIDIDSKYISNKDELGNVSEIKLLISSKTSLSYIVYDNNDNLNDDFVIQTQTECNK